MDLQKIKEAREQGKQIIEKMNDVRFDVIDGFVTDVKSIVNNTEDEEIDNALISYLHENPDAEEFREAIEFVVYANIKELPSFTNCSLNRLISFSSKLFGKTERQYPTETLEFAKMPPNDLFSENDGNNVYKMNALRFHYYIANQLVEVLTNRFEDYGAKLIKCSCENPKMAKEGGITLQLTYSIKLPMK